MKISLKVKRLDLKGMSTEIKCPKCGKAFTEKISVLRPGGIRKCPSCGITIEYTGENVARKMRKALSDAFK